MHYVGFVVCDSESQIAEVVAPYDEALDVEPYDDGDYTEENDGSMWNPNGKWDWYAVGGRWGDYIPGNTCLVSEVLKKKTEPYLPSILVAEDGWHEIHDASEFELLLRLAPYNGKRVYVVDFHR